MTADDYKRIFGEWGQRVVARCLSDEKYTVEMHPAYMPDDYADGMIISKRGNIPFAIQVKACALDGKLDKRGYRMKISVITNALKRAEERDERYVLAVVSINEIWQHVHLFVDSVLQDALEEEKISFARFGEVSDFVRLLYDRERRPWPMPLSKEEIDEGLRLYAETGLQSAEAIRVRLAMKYGNDLR